MPLGVEPLVGHAGDAAERSGAPLQAFIRVDDKEITNHNQVRHPDHIVILDRTLIVPEIDAAMKPGGTIIVNTTPERTDCQENFSGRKLASIDATGIAVAKAAALNKNPAMIPPVLRSIYKSSV